MKVFILIACSLIAASYAKYTNCPNSLCKWKPNGASFRVSNANPGFFVTCANGGSTCTQCPGNLIFDNHLRVCVRPKTYTTAKPYNTHVPFKPHKVHVHSVHCPNELCKWKPNGALLSLPGKPTYFVQCNNNKSVCFQCPAGLEFNPAIKVCDSPSQQKY